MTTLSGPHRREWIARILQLAAGASLATHGAAAAWTPQILTAAQNDALIAIGERIIPQSSAAFCNRIIDLVLTQESEQTRAQLTGALAAFASDADGAALMEAAAPASRRR